MSHSTFSSSRETAAVPPDTRGRAAASLAAAVFGALDSAAATPRSLLKLRQQDQGTAGAEATRPPKAPTLRRVKWRSRRYLHSYPVPLLLRLLLLLPPIGRLRPPIAPAAAATGRNITFPPFGETLSLRRLAPPSTAGRGASRIAAAAIHQKHPACKLQHRNFIFLPHPLLLPPATPCHSQRRLQQQASGSSNTTAAR
ncbi:hypothetical protein cyc_02452 [Cyclospora cayetanensis]|uniref:Uncharacterized protein n=1 Tax=Cyclospora cayetanensis TaxID=88456 RepID=A0A1D3D8R4_9EIME|nr:hypothetical protein cyc_02452 [Cyclospora cayetanensis]